MVSGIAQFERLTGTSHSLVVVAGVVDAVLVSRKWSEIKASLEDLENKLDADAYSETSNQGNTYIHACNLLVLF